MPRYRHPRADDGHPPAQIHVSRGHKAAVADDGTFEAPAPVAEAIARDHGVDVSEMAVGDDTETCDVVKQDGDVCGRDLPCPYHS